MEELTPEEERAIAALIIRIVDLEHRRPGSFDQMVAKIGDPDLVERFKAAFGRDPAANDR